MEPKYYLPISSKSLAHYFSSACLMPSKYFQNKPNDLQNRFKDFLLVTTNLGTNDTDCCLDLIFTDDELNELIDIHNGFFLYQKPLPISRVKTVLFSDRDQMEQTIVNITMSTAFVPKKLIKIISKFDAIETSKLEQPSNLILKDWLGQINQFNSFLGGFALMRLAGEEYMNYTENYFSTLSFFNDVIKRDLLKAGHIVDNRYIDAFFGESSFKRLHRLINKDVDENDLYEIANEEKQNIVKDKITRLIDLKNLEKATYIVAILNTYGVGDEAKKKKIDGLILSNFKSEIKADKSEVVALCFGLNKGYSVFPKSYKSGSNEKTIKFQLNSQLDYYTIESIYQYVFNKIKAERLSYIDYWCPKMFDKNLSKKKNDFQILDVVVIGKKKPKVFSQEYISNLLQRFFQKETEPYLKGFIEQLRDTIYNDTKEEVHDEIGIENMELKNELDKVKLLENNKTKPKIEYDVQNSDTSIDKNVVEKSLTYTNNLDKKFIIKQVLQYKVRTKAMLEKEANERGIFIPKGAKIDDIIFLLMTASGTESKIQFPE